MIVLIVGIDNKNLWVAKNMFMSEQQPYNSTHFVLILYVAVKPFHSVNHYHKTSIQKPVHYRKL